MTTPTTLDEIATTVGLHIMHKPLTHHRGWPTKSTKPWHLVWASDGRLVASFRTRDLLERNLRGRAGC